MQFNLVTNYLPLYAGLSNFLLKMIFLKSNGQQAYTLLFLPLHVRLVEHWVNV